MNILEGISRIVQANSGLTAYLALTVSIFGITTYYLSSLLASPTGRAALWYALVANTPKRYYRLLIVTILRSISEPTTLFSRRGKALKVRLPGPRITSGAISLALAATAASFSVSSLFGVQAALGPISFSDVSQSGAWGSVAMLVLVALAGYSVFSARRNYAARFVAIFITFSLVSSPDEIFFGPSSSIAVIQLFSVLSLLLTICCRSGLEAISALICIVLLFVFFSHEELSYDALYPVVELAGLAAGALALALIVSVRNGSRHLAVYAALAVSALVISNLRCALASSCAGASGLSVGFPVVLGIATTLAALLSDLVSRRASGLIQPLVLLLLSVVAVLIISIFQPLSMWSKVLTVSMFVVLPVLLLFCYTSAITISLNLLACGLKNDAVLVAAIGTVVSVIVALVGLAGLLGFFRNVEARPGTLYIDPENVIETFFGVTSGSIWLFALFFITVVPALLHLTLSGLSVAALMPQFLRRQASGLLERDERMGEGLPKVLASQAIALWITLWVGSVLTLFFAGFQLLGRNSVDIIKSIATILSII